MNEANQERDAEGGMLFDHAGLRPAALTQTLRDHGLERLLENLHLENRTAIAIEGYYYRTVSYRYSRSPLSTKGIAQEKYKVKELGIFGSYVRSEQNAASDVDILIDFEQSPSLLRFIESENYLSDAIEIKIDLVMKRVLEVIRKENLKRD
jgi:hypothetical protein